MKRLRVGAVLAAVPLALGMLLIGGGPAQATTGSGTVTHTSAGAPHTDQSLLRIEGIQGTG